MRLQELRHVLEALEPDLQIHVSGIKGTTQQQQQQNRRLSGVHRAMESVRVVWDAGVLQSETERVLAFEEVADAVGDSIVVATETANQVSAALNQLRQRVQLLVSTLSSTLEEESETHVAFKLPSTKSLEGAGEVMKSLDKILHQALANKHTKARIELRGFDRGSEWVVVTLGTLAAVSVLGHMVQLHFSIQEKKIELEARQESLKTLKLRNDTIEEINEAIGKQLDVHYQAELAALLRAGGIPSEDNEQIERIKHSLKLLGDLLRDGLEVHPALAVPVTSRILFPQLPRLLKAPRELPEEAESASDEP